MKVFYEPNIEQNECLTEVESGHAIRVLRLSNNDQIEVLDGKGGAFIAEIINPNPKKCLLKILKKHIIPNKKPFYIHLAIAPTKNLDRIEWMIEKCVEIGIDEITFLKCERSERKELKVERIEKIAIAAMKQSGGLFLPKINELLPLNTFLKLDSQNKPSQKFIGYITESVEISLYNSAKIGQNYLFLVGPEGDFSEKELEQTNSFGFQKVNLGSKRLRTETAGLVVCHTLNLINS